MEDVSHKNPSDSTGITQSFVFRAICTFHMKMVGRTAKTRSVTILTPIASSVYPHGDSIHENSPELKNAANLRLEARMQWPWTFLSHTNARG